MGHAQGMSMLYLEARCLAVVRAAGSQGVQNGSISCVALVLSVPGGTRAILAENVLAAWLDLEVASGNDAIASHSEIRKTAKLMGQFLPGTDFVTSGYSVMPRHDNTFGGGNYDADDLDEWLTIQRDWQVDAGIEPVARTELLGSASGRLAPCRRSSQSSGCPPITEEEVALATTGYDARELPDRDRPRTSRRRTTARPRRLGARRRARARPPRVPRRRRGGVRHAAPARVAADYLQTSAVIGADGVVRSAVNDPNEYAGPGTGYRLDGERWELLQALPQVVAPPDAARRHGGRRSDRRRAWRRGAGDDPAEVVVAVGPAFADAIRRTIDDLDHRAVLDAVCEGIGRAAAPAARARAPRRRRRVHRARRRAACRARAWRSGCSRRARR